jgi:hypothetical protein
VPLARLQRGLETLYRVDTGIAVEQFVIDEDARAALAPTRRSREQLLVIQDDDDACLALFIDPAVLANLEHHDPGRTLGNHNFGDFLLAIEGVSHFVYAAFCANADRPVTQLELELQAEVDKFVTCLLCLDPEANVSEALRHRLFTACVLDADLDDDEHARYRAANDNAFRYATYLEQSFVAPRRIPAMLDELRRFYRLGLAAKLAWIAGARAA